MAAPSQLILPDAVRDAMIGHAQRTPALECCGLLIGIGDELVTVLEACAVRNIATTPQRRFEIDPQEQFRLLRETRGGDLRIVGHYHSHPEGPPEPSAYDRDMAHDPEAVWCIIGLNPPVVEAFVCPDQAIGFVRLPVIARP
ncbi:MAG: M67 family metallopeptidase [Rhodospirillaceae bacterium]|nr:M67 family metallopeptidase [Rhodospirillaceae bacterium]